MSALVSILVVTYNHERYIEQCLQSLLEQEATFPYEIIVCNDASTDSTFQKCSDISDGNANIQLFNHEKNIGVSANFEFGLRQCKGKYVAFCDGDDYWIHPNKLQIMVAYFEENPGCSMVYSDAGRIEEESNTIIKNTLTDQPDKFQITDVLDKIGPAVNSMMVRRNIFPNHFPKEFFKVVNPDIFMNIWALDVGYGHYINTSMSMYRVHSGGVWSRIDRKERNIIHWGSRVIAFGTMGKKYTHLQEQCIERLTQMLANTLKKGDKILFNRYFGNLPLRNRMEFRAKRAYYKLFVKN
jgi:glycosyltransferase involved in cell wall biosynthesis